MPAVASTGLPAVEDGTPEGVVGEELSAFAAPEIGTMRLNAP